MMFKWLIPACFVTFPFTPLTAPVPGDCETIPFEIASLHLEYNATDDDAEIVFTIDADTGMKEIKVIAPNDKVVLRLQSKHTHHLGVTKMVIETPEPSLEEVQTAYPEGTYRFVGETEEGDTMFSTWHLTHALPEAPSITFPQEGAVNVPVRNAVGTWNAVPGVTGYAIEVEEEEQEIAVEATLTADMATNFSFPGSWMLHDKEYAFGVAAIAANGNVTVTEVHFFTNP